MRNLSGRIKSLWRGPTIIRSGAPDAFYILVLYWSNFRTIPKSQLDNIFGIHLDFPEHNYVFHDITYMPVEELKEFDFDIILLDATFLSLRMQWADSFNATKTRLEFIKASKAVKIAFPQDEYDRPAILDRWLSEWKVNVIYSCFPENKDILYPNAQKVARIFRGYPGYISDEMIQRVTPPISTRRTDVGYRARRLSPRYGKLGKLKVSVAELVENEARQMGFQTDIKVGDENFIYHDSWYDFIEQCKTTLGTPSGSGVIDLEGEIDRNVVDLLLQDPDLTFQEIYSAHISGFERIQPLTSISPRNIEAGILGTCQILVNSSYSEILEPWKHYLPLELDGSNVKEVLNELRSPEYLQLCASRCREQLLDFSPLRRREHNAELIEAALITPSEPSASRRYPLFEIMAERIKNNFDWGSYLLMRMGRVRGAAEGFLLSTPVIGRRIRYMWRSFRMQHKK
jgi:hypothetical protein